MSGSIEEIVDSLVEGKTPPWAVGCGSGSGSKAELPSCPHCGSKNWGLDMGLNVNKTVFRRAHVTPSGSTVHDEDDEELSSSLEEVDAGCITCGNPAGDLTDEILNFYRDSSQEYS